MHNKAKFLNTTDEQKERIEKIRLAFSNIYEIIENVCKGSRETALVFTKLEEAQFWAIKGITRENKEGE